MNTLYYGDNLDILREHLPAESVDLIYLDPPFNSNRNYNVLFRDESGQESEAQIVAFEDTWHWNHHVEAHYHALVTEGTEKVSRAVSAMRALLGTNSMSAYLVEMTIRLIELHRVLKPTGSLYLHCDPTASHYLKVMLDTIFDAKYFRSEVVWERTGSHNASKRYGPNHDVLLFYTASDSYNWNQQFNPHSESLLASHYRYQDEDGRRYTLSDLTGRGLRNGASGQPWRGYDPASKGNHWVTTVSKLEEWDQQGLIYWPASGGWPRFKRYLDAMKGAPLQEVWTDIPPINAKAAERLGYPTQKPLALLERILCASSNPGDVVLDPFAGCGTAVAAAQKLDRQWIGIDITHLAVALMRYRMEAMFPGCTFKVIGEPKDLAGARKLASEDRYQFQWWALSLLCAKPLGGAEGSKTGKKGSDRGVDGVINFIDDASGQPKRVIIQVKSGHVTSGQVRDLRGVLDREQAAIGVFLTLEPATREMQTEAASAGVYESAGWGTSHPRLQVLTIEDLLHGAQVAMPPPHGTFKQAEAVKPPAHAGQGKIDL